MLSLKGYCLGIVFAVFTLMCAPFASAQTITGSVSGSVVDTSGGVIPGETVIITADKTGQSRTVTTESEGRFSFAALQPGSYTIKVERQDFKHSNARASF